MKCDLCRVLRTAGLVSAAMLPAAAEAQVETFGELANSLKPGDMVAVTEWSGQRTTGRLSELTACSLVLVTTERRVEVPATATRVIKRLQRVETSGTKQRAVDAGRVCEQPGCVAVTLAVGGTTAVTRGFRRLFNRPRIVYRAHADVSPRSCGFFP